MGGFDMGYGRFCPGLVICFVVLGMGVERGHAQSRKGVVIESHMNVRAAEMDYLLPAIKVQLDSLGFYAKSADVSHLIRTRHSQSGATLSEGDAGKVVELLERAHRNWTDARPQDALAAAGEAHQLLLTRPASIATKLTMRDGLHKLYTLMSLAHNRLGNGRQSREAMASLIRAFPHQLIDFDTFGPEALGLYQSEKRRLRSQRSGVLHIVTTPAHADVFLDGRLLSASEKGSQRLIPGKYRVFVRVRGSPGRVHTAVVRPNVTTRLHIDYGLDSVLRLDSFAALMLTDARDRYRVQNDHALDLGRAMKLPLVVVLNVDVVRSHVAIVGTLLSVKKRRVVRMAGIHIKPHMPSVDELRRFARHLAGTDKPGGSVFVIEHRKGRPVFLKKAAVLFGMGG